MMNYPDFISRGYKVIDMLGQNQEGGRITWLASSSIINKHVVIKQFRFAQKNSKWSVVQDYEREIEVLKDIDHPNIPRYLEQFETEDGFCLIQEYKDAPSLDIVRTFEPEEVKQIAVKILEIFVYLQNRIPPIIHRDVKPANILVDKQLNVYLIDFGMSRVGSQEVTGSSVFKGTPGFIPPEQIKKPTEASDLYGLGATLICLLTGTKSTEIQKLTDDEDYYLIHFRDLLPRLSPRFLDWLESMVKPKQRERFINAEEALKALKPLDIIRVPTINLTKSVIKFQANQIGEKLQQEITILNTMPETLLEGKWEVAPHLKDPPHSPDYHSWIMVKPASFKGNNTKFKIFVDTSKLMADKLYQRELLLRSNADVEVSSLKIQIKTAPLPVKKELFPYLEFVSLWLIFVGLTYGVLTYSDQILNNFVFTFILKVFVFNESTIPDIVFYSGSIVMIIGIVWGFLVGLSGVLFFGPFPPSITMGFGILLAGVAGIIDGFTYGIQSGMSFAIFYALVMGIVGALVGAVLGLIFTIVGGISSLIGGLFGYSIGYSIRFLTIIIARLENIKLSLFTIGFGISSGFSLVYGISNYQIVLALTSMGLPLTTILVYPPIKRHKLLVQYRKSESHLIKP